MVPDVRRAHSFAVFAIAALLLRPLLKAQDGASVKVDVNVVNVVLGVRDRRGGLVGNLRKDDFTIFEDGKQQEIKYFNRETDLPLTIGLLIDTSISRGNLVEMEKNAASQFFGSVLRPKDLAFLIGFGEEAELLQDYTNSAKLLRMGLEGLHGSASVSDGVQPMFFDTRVLNDAVYLAADEQLRGQVGRKVLLVITDGADKGSRYHIDRAIQAAQKGDAKLYGLFYPDSKYYRQFCPIARLVLEHPSDAALLRMADETGGHVFRIDRKNALDEAFKELQDEMRSQYAIGYTPTNPAKDGTFRRIEIQTKNKDWKVQARKGYYATAPQ